MASRTWTLRWRDVVAAATVWVPFVVFTITATLWAGVAAATVELRNDFGTAAPALPVWVIALVVAIVLVGVSVGAISVVPEGPNDASTRRVPLFWAGAVAGFVCAIWLFQSWVVLNPPVDGSRFNALAGFATIGAALYGLLPFFIANRPSRTDEERDNETT
jgi:hypothetical protein